MKVALRDGLMGGAVSTDFGALGTLRRRRGCVDNNIWRRWRRGGHALGTGGVSGPLWAMAVLVLTGILSAFSAPGWAESVCYTQFSEGDLHWYMDFGFIREFGGESVVPNTDVAGNPVFDSDENMYFTRREMVDYGLPLPTLSIRLCKRNTDESVDVLNELLRVDLNDIGSWQWNLCVVYLAIAPDGTLYYTLPWLVDFDLNTVIMGCVREYGGEEVASGLNVGGTPVCDFLGNLYYTSGGWDAGGGSFFLHQRDTYGTVHNLGRIVGPVTDHVEDWTCHLAIAPDGTVYYTHPRVDDALGTPIELGYIKAFGGETIVSDTELGGNPAFDAAGRLYFTARTKDLVSPLVQDTLYCRKAEGSVDNLGLIVDHNGPPILWDYGCYLATSGYPLPDVILNKKVRGGIRVVRYKLSDGSVVTRKYGPNEAFDHSLLQIPPNTKSGILLKMKAELLRKLDNSHLPPDQRPRIKAVRGGMGKRAKEGGDCLPPLEALLTDWTPLEDDDTVFGTDGDELTINGPLTPEDSGTYIILYYSAPDGQWLRTQQILLEVTDQPTPPPEPVCGVPRTSLEEALDYSGFQDLVEIVCGTPDCTDVDGAAGSTSYILDDFELAVFQACLFGNTLHPLEPEAAEAYAYNRLLLESDNLVVVEVLRAAGALPFAAATLSMSTTWQDAWRDFGLSNTYQLVAGLSKGGNGEPFSPEGDLDGDGLTNLQEFDLVVAAGGTVEDYIAAVDPALVTEDPAMPVYGGLGLAVVAFACAVAGAHVLRKRRDC